MEGDDIPIDDAFPNEHLHMMEKYILQISGDKEPWFADIVNYLVYGEIPPGLSPSQRKKFYKHMRHYYWNEPLLFKRGPEGILRRCVPDDDIESVIRHCHSLPCGGHASAHKTSAKVLQSGFFWPNLFRDV